MVLKRKGVETKVKVRKIRELVNSFRDGNALSIIVEDRPYVP
jgi:hypothetical protein